MSDSLASNISRQLQDHYYARILHEHPLGATGSARMLDEFAAKLAGDERPFAAQIRNSILARTLPPLTLGNIFRLFVNENPRPPRKMLVTPDGCFIHIFSKNFAIGVPWAPSPPAGPDVAVFDGALLANSSVPVMAPFRPEIVMRHGASLLFHESEILRTNGVDLTRTQGGYEIRIKPKKERAIGISSADLFWRRIAGLDPKVDMKQTFEKFRRTLLECAGFGLAWVESQDKADASALAILREELFGHHSGSLAFTGQLRGSELSERLLGARVMALDALISGVENSVTGSGVNVDRLKEGLESMLDAVSYLNAAYVGNPWLNEFVDVKIADGFSNMPWNRDIRGGSLRDRIKLFEIIDRIVEIAAEKGMRSGQAASVIFGKGLNPADLVVRVEDYAGLADFSHRMPLTSGSFFDIDVRQSGSDCCLSIRSKGRSHGQSNVIDFPREGFDTSHTLARARLERHFEGPLSELGTIAGGRVNEYLGHIAGHMGITASVLPLAAYPLAIQSAAVGVSPIGCLV